MKITIEFTPTEHKTIHKLISELLEATKQALNEIDNPKEPYATITTSKS